MAVKSKKQTVQELLGSIQLAAEQKEYNPAEDFKILAAQYRKLDRWEFGQLLEAMAGKYENEWSCIHAALMAKARSGDLEAIRLYRELMTQTAQAGNEVSIVDDIG